MKQNRRPKNSPLCIRAINFYEDTNNTKWGNTAFQQMVPRQLDKKKKE